MAGASESEEEEEEEPESESLDDGAVSTSSPSLGFVAAAATAAAARTARAWLWLCFECVVILHGERIEWTDGCARERERERQKGGAAMPWRAREEHQRHGITARHPKTFSPSDSKRAGFFSAPVLGCAAQQPS